MRALVLAAALFAAAPASAADSWGLEHERLAVIEGKVVDLLCELSGDCPADCGAGERQLGILAADGRLWPAVKSATFFAGAVKDLLPYCGRTIQADALIVEHPEMPLLFVQNVRESADAPWTPTDAFEKAWKAEHGDAPEWWRADPTVKAVIAADGVYGIPGLEPEK